MCFGEDKIKNSRHHRLWVITIGSRVLPEFSVVYVYNNPCINIAATSARIA
jgi:hypothetical protein